MVLPAVAVLARISGAIRVGCKQSTIDEYIEEYKTLPDHSIEELNALLAQKMKGGKKDVDRRLFEKKTVELKEPKKSKSRRH